MGVLVHCVYNVFMVRAHWRRWCTQKVLHVRTTCPSSVKEVTAVNWAFVLNSVTKLRCTVHCSCCALWKRTVHSDYNVCHEWSYMSQKHEVHYTGARNGAGDALVERIKGSQRVPAPQIILQQWNVNLACILSRKSGAQCTALFVHYATAYCTGNSLRDTNIDVKVNVPSTLGALKMSRIQCSVVGEN